MDSRPRNAKRRGQRVLIPARGTLRQMAVGTKAWHEGSESVGGRCGQVCGSTHNDKTIDIEN